MPFFETVTLHVVLPGSGADGVNVIVVAGVPGAGDCVKACGVPAGHSRLKASAAAVTFSLSVTVIADVIATPAAPAAGDVVLTAGGSSVTTAPCAVTEKSSIDRKSVV